MTPELTKYSRDLTCREYGRLYFLASLNINKRWRNKNSRRSLLDYVGSGVRYQHAHIMARVPMHNWLHAYAIRFLPTPFAAGRGIEWAYRRANGDRPLLKST